MESEYECGHKFPHVDITNFDLKTDFEEGDIVSEANGSSNYEIINYTADPDGTLRGQFYLVMDAWGGAKIACEFWDTKVNTDNVVITTRYRSIDLPGYVANPDEIQRYVKSLWLDANSVATSSKIRDTIVIKEKFDYLYTAADGTLYAVVVNSDGTTTETEVHTNKNTSQCLITDGQGDSLVISQKGQPMGIKEYRATGGNKALLKEYHRKSDSLAQWQINFTKYDAQTYAFDHIGSGNHGIFNTDLYYPKSGSYDFRYKSVESGKIDKVIVDFGSYPEKDSVIFKDKYGVKLKVVDGNILSFTGVSRADTNFIYAYRGDQKIGKLFLNTYQQKTYKVVLISVNEATLPNTTDLENELNKVYNQCAVSFKIETRKLQVSGIENFTHGGTKVAGSVWNASQKTVLEAFGEKYEDNTAYLFFIPKAETGGVAGYMPRYYPYGFIYPGAANRTIAHELGHGIAGLEHPFPESQVSGSTQNLMDYRDGEELWHFQWDMLQDPSRKIFKWWQNEEGAENVELLDKEAKYVVWVFSPYFSHFIHSEIANWTVNKSDIKARRIAELFLQASIKDLPNKDIIAKNVNNKCFQNVDLDALRKAILNTKKCAVSEHRLVDSQKRYTIFYLVSGTQPVQEHPEELQSIDNEYCVKRVEWKVDDMFDYMADTDFDETQYAGHWVANESKAYANRNQLSYKRHFEFDNGYYNIYYKLLELENGDLFLAKPDKYSDNLEISYYIKPKGVKSWYETKLEFFPISTDVTNKTDAIAFDAFKFVGRYVIPIEDVLILIDGKDFDGDDASRWMHGASLVVDLIPVAGKVFKLVKTGSKAGKSVSKYTINTVLKEEVKETINKATKAFVIEVGTQFTINFIDALLCKKDNPVFWAISEIDFIDKAQLSLNSVTNYLPDNKNNKTLSEAIVCAEKACMAFKKAKEDKDANALKDAAITCIFDVIINMDSHWIATKVPNKKIKTFCDNWSKIMKQFHQLYPNLSTASFIALGDIFEQFYYHE